MLAKEYNSHESDLPQLSELYDMDCASDRDFEDAADQVF